MAQEPPKTTLTTSRVHANNPRTVKFSLIRHPEIPYLWPQTLLPDTVLAEFPPIYGTN